MPKYTLDLFSVLKMLDRGDMNIHETLANDPAALKELKAAAGWMLPQWSSASYNERDHRDLIKKFDEHLSIIWNSTSGHPILQLRLLAACGLGRPTKHKFYKRSDTKYGNCVMDLLLQLAPDVTQEDVEKWVERNTEDDAEELARRCGYQSKELKSVLVEFRRMKQ